MMRKFLVYCLLFISLIGINLFLVKKIYLSFQKQSEIQKILAEISQLNNPQKQFQLSAAPYVLGNFQSEITIADGRVANLKSFFRRYNSPLFDYADLIVAVSDQYHFDYRLLPAIAMQESNLCKYIPENSYNCWGWGIYGDKVTRFSSYEEAIKTVAKGLKEHYLDKGLVTASKIMEKYTPSSNGSWARGVNTFLKVLE
ncbi:MAG: hypothetical protein ACK4FL_04025 [Microgenomates group bacterium]